MHAEGSEVLTYIFCKIKLDWFCQKTHLSNLLLQQRECKVGNSMKKQKYQ